MQAGVIDADYKNFSGNGNLHERYPVLAAPHKYRFSFGIKPNRVMMINFCKSFSKMTGIAHHYGLSFKSAQGQLVYFFVGDTYFLCGVMSLHNNESLSLCDTIVHSTIFQVINNKIIMR